MANVNVFAGVKMVFAVTESSAWLALAGVVIGWALKTCTEYWSHRRVFDQRLRLEKEYQLYLDLWDKLFEFRRTIGTAISPHTHPEDMPTDDNILLVFNEFQLVVRRGEPFFCVAVARPASKTTLPARQLVRNVQEINHLNRQPGDNGERIYNLETENETTFKSFDTEYEMIKAAIRKRVGPP